MPRRRSSFQWSPANIVILVVVTVLVALGAAYWAQVSQQIGSGLGAQVGGASKLKQDPKCVPTAISCKDLGSFTFDYVLTAKDEDGDKDVDAEDAKKTAIKNSLLWINGTEKKPNNCTTKTYPKTQTGGKPIDTIRTSTQVVTITSETGVALPKACKDEVNAKGCGVKKDPKKPVPECVTRCEVQKFICTPAAAEANCKVVGEATPDGGSWRVKVTCSVPARLDPECKCNTSCYVERGRIEVGGEVYNEGDDKKDEVTCVCATKTAAENLKGFCATNMPKKCDPETEIFILDPISVKKGPGGKDVPSANNPVAPGEQWVLYGRCVKKTTSTPAPTASTTPAPTIIPPTGTANPTATVVMTPVPGTQTPVPSTSPLTI